MSLGWVIAGSIVQVLLALFLFIIVVFSGAGIANGNNLTPLQLGILNFSLFALPFSCILSAGIVLFLYKSGAGPSAYWWYTAPLILAGVYIFYALSLTNLR